MLCELHRDAPSSDATLGRLSVNGVFECWTLEPSEEGPQHPAIPAGDYKIIINRSTRFDRLLPLIIGVPGRFGIRIHPGNDAADTTGCILLGTAKAADEVLNSRVACQAFQSKIAAVLAAGESVLLHVINAPAGVV